MKQLIKSTFFIALVLVLTIGTVFCWNSPSWASFQDDRFDGNIFALYAGNGSLLPPKTTLEKSLASDKPTLLTFFVEDSRDCKAFSSVISSLQAYYGKVSDIIPISADTLFETKTYAPGEPGYYFEGYLPQTLLFDTKGEIVFNQSGIVPFEEIDDRYRELFNLLPRSESVELKRRPLNEVNASMVE